MATDIKLVKRCGVLMPLSEHDTEILQEIAEGEVVNCSISKPRNIKFHRKYFSLLDVLFDIFSPEPIQKGGLIATKNRERFRKDIAIATGHYELVVNIKGECRAEAKSISFAKMDDIQFSKLYNDTINYGLQKIANGKTREELENWVNAIMDYT